MSGIRAFLLIGFIWSAVSCYAQQIPFLLTVNERSNWKGIKIDSIPYLDFHDEKMVKLVKEKKMNGDSLLRVFARRYAQSIVLSDSCCILKGIDKELKFCNRRPKDDKLSTGYGAVGFQNGYLIIMDSGYESWSYTCFDPVTRKYAETLDKPRFINREIIYSLGNYYSEGQFMIHDVSQNKLFGFATFNWELTGWYQQDRSIYLRFDRRFYGGKYLKVSF